MWSKCGLFLRRMRIRGTTSHWKYFYRRKMKLFVSFALFLSAASALPQFFIPQQDYRLAQQYFGGLVYSVNPAPPVVPSAPKETATDPVAPAAGSTIDLKGLKETSIGLLEVLPKILDQLKVKIGEAKLPGAQNVPEELSSLSEKLSDVLQILPEILDTVQEKVGEETDALKNTPDTLEVENVEGLDLDKVNTLIDVVPKILGKLKGKIDVESATLF